MTKKKESKVPQAVRDALVVVPSLSMGGTGLVENVGPQQKEFVRGQAVAWAPYGGITLELDGKTYVVLEPYEVLATL